MRQHGFPRARGDGRGADAWRPEVPDDAAGGWDTGRPRRFGPGLVLVVLAAVVGLGLLGRGSATVSAPEPEQFAIERATEAVALPRVSGETTAARRARRALEPLPLVPLGWVKLPDAPMNVVYDSPVVPTATGIVTVGARGGRLVLAEADLRGLGGRTDAETPTSGVWTEQRVAPLSARADPYVGVLGPELRVVWGGREGVTGDGPWLTDGAVLDTATGAWELLPELPSVKSPVTAGWAGGQLTVVGRSVADVPVAYGWRLGDEGWRTVATPPTPSITTIDSVAVDGDLLVYGIADGLGVMRSQLFTLAYDVASDTWRAFEYVPLQSPERIIVVPMEDDEVFMWGRPSTNAVNGQPDGLTLSLRDGSWQQADSAGISADGGGTTVMLSPRNLTAAWTGRSIIIAGDPDVHMLAYWPSLDEWAALSPPAGPIGGRITSAQGHIVRWGGVRNGEAQPELWIFPGTGQERAAATGRG